MIVYFHCKKSYTLVVKTCIWKLENSLKKIFFFLNQNFMSKHFNLKNNTNFSFVGFFFLKDSVFLVLLFKTCSNKKSIYIFQSELPTWKSLDLSDRHRDGFTRLPEFNNPGKLNCLEIINKIKVRKILTRIFVWWKI